MNAPRLKRPRLRWILLIIIIMLPTVDCLFRDKRFVEVGETADGFESLPGAIGLTFSIKGLEKGKPVRLAIRDGKISAVAQLPPARRSAIVGSMKPSESWLGAKLVPTGPYLLSPDESLLAAAAETSSHKYALLILDARTFEARTHINMTDEDTIGGIAWSPDGQYVGVITSRLHIGFCLGEIIWVFAGHPSSSLSRSLDVFDISGALIVSQPLTSRSDWKPQLVWIE